jgi:hypothetical protein
VIELPDGSPGTIPAAATDVPGPTEAAGPAVVLDAAGCRRLRDVVAVLAARVRAPGDGAGGRAVSAGEPAEHAQHRQVGRSH